MDQKPDLILEDIERTRTHLGQNMSALEERLERTVETTKHSAEDIFKKVKQTAQDFTPSRQLQKHPLVYFGGAVFSGFALGTWIGKHFPETRQWVTQTGPVGDSGEIEEKIPEPVPMTSEYEELGGHGDRAAVSSDRWRRGTLSARHLKETFLNTFDEEIQMVRNMFLAEAFKRVRDNAKKKLPQVAPQIEDIAQSALSKVKTRELQDSH